MKGINTLSFRKSCQEHDYPESITTSYKCGKGSFSQGPRDAGNAEKIKFRGNHIA